MSHFINFVRRVLVEGPLEGELHIRLIYETCPPLQRGGLPFLDFFIFVNVL